MRYLCIDNKDISDITSGNDLFSILKYCVLSFLYIKKWNKYMRFNVTYLSNHCNKKALISKGFNTIDRYRNFSISLNNHPISIGI